MNSGVIGNQFLSQQPMQALGQSSYYQQVDRTCLDLQED